MAAWLHIRAVRDPDRFDAWLHRLLVHACYREARRVKQREVVEIHMTAPDARGHGDAQDLTAMRDQLERGFRRLTPEQRAVLVVHHYLGLPDAEAAIVLDIAGRHLQVPAASAPPPPFARPSKPTNARRPSPRSPSHDRPRRLRPDARRLVRGRRAVARARRWSRPGPRRHAPPQAPPGVARRSRQPTGSGRRPMPVRAPGVRSLPRFGPRWTTALIFAVARRRPSWVAAILVGARLVQPSPLPTGRLGHLAYGLDGDIFVADWDGRNPIRIADGPPGSGPASAAVTGERDRCGRPTGGISLIDRLG